jgi:DNA-binding GntR family transcriptional regulator
MSLTQQHGISHRTAAHALATLKHDGLIISARGKGYYVTPARSR